jgi:hypothetical protein
MKTAIKGFKIKGGTIACSDPCYRSPCVLEPAKNGNWVAHAETSDEGSWGVRVSKITVHHEDFSPIGNSYDVAEHVISVDSGQAGVFEGSICYGDEAFYERCCKATLSKPGYGYVEGGFVSSSGYGDGGYSCLVYKKNGKAVGVEIIFIDGDQDEDMPDMEPSDEEAE